MVILFLVAIKNGANMRVNLKVPYEEKDEAKRKGAHWDGARKTWFVTNVENLKQFSKWIPAHLMKPSEPYKSTLPKFKRDKTPKTKPNKKDSA